MFKIISNLIYMENPLPDIKLKNSAFTFALENNLSQSIVNKIKLIPKYDQLKNDIEITEHVCNLVENSVTNNKDSKPINKKQLVIKIMSSLFNLNNDADKKIVDQQTQQYSESLNQARAAQQEIEQLKLQNKELNVLNMDKARQIDELKERESRKKDLNSEQQRLKASITRLEEEIRTLKQTNIEFDARIMKI